jgi:hypothetical protein
MGKVMNLFILLCILLLFFSCDKKTEARNNERIVEKKAVPQISKEKTAPQKNKPKSVDVEINGVYEVISAYTHLFDDYRADRKIETEKLGSMITINNGKVVFGNEEYDIYDGYYDFDGYAILEYEYFLLMFAGMNYGAFDENIIGKDYAGKVKFKTIKNEKAEYHIYFADNKLIIEIRADRHETEFEPLIRVAEHDLFFYITEKVPDLNNLSVAASALSDFIIDENGTITEYRGAGGNLIIPAEIDGKPVRAIGDKAFRNKGLTSVTIASGIKSIGEYAFWWNNLTDVTIPDSVNSIGKGAFWGNQLTSIVIPDSVSSIEDATFFVNQLTQITIPKNITSISDRAFCRNQLTKIIIPDTVTSIGNRAFQSNQLTSISIPNSVISIGFDAFNRNKLTTATIPASVTSIGSNAFSHNQLENITIPVGIANIDPYSFSNNKLTHIAIPEGVVSVGYGAFRTNLLTSVSLPASLKSIGQSAFNNNQLTSISIPDGVSSVEMWAFTKNQLASVAFGNAITDISETAFDNAGFLIQYLCNNKKSATYKLGSEKRNDDFIYVETEYGAYITMFIGSTRSTLVIPDKINGIDVKGTIGPDELVFWGTSEYAGNVLQRYNITHLVLPEGLVYIGKGSFNGGKLTSVSLPSTLRYIGNNAFLRCGLTNITIPNGVISIGNLAFSSNQLTSVVIPNTVTELRYRAFGNNDHLTSISIGDSMPSLSNPDIVIFDNDFDNFYRTNGMKAGTYAFNGGKWGVE